MKNKKYIFNDNNYELIKDYKDGFDKETVIRRTNIALVENIKTSFVDECL